MDEVKKEESHMTSPAAFVEGGIQEACDDACSICLEAFCDSDPSTVTSCKHEFHLQCVLEWCQRSSNCPMCWQNITLKDPTSQELLEAVERERSIRLTPPRNTTTIFHHPTLGDFELQHLPVGIDDPELEERIIQHLAAAAAMGRNHRAARGEGLRSHSSANALPQFLLLSANPNEASNGRNSSFLTPSEVETETHATGTNSSVSITNIGVEDQQNLSSSVQHNISSESGPRSQPIHITRRGVSNDNRGDVANQDSAGPSEFQSPSESWKSRFSSLSMKYKDSISRNTRGWKEKLFSRSSSMAEIGSEVKRELNAGIAKVSRMMEHLETRENRRAGHADNAVNSSSTERSGNECHAETSHEAKLDGNRATNSTTPSSVSS